MSELDTRSTGQLDMCRVDSKPVAVGNMMIGDSVQSFFTLRFVKVLLNEYMI